MIGFIDFIEKIESFFSIEIFFYLFPTRAGGKINMIERLGSGSCVKDCSGYERRF